MILAHRTRSESSDASSTIDAALRANREMEKLRAKAKKAAAQAKPLPRPQAFRPIHPKPGQPCANFKVPARRPRPAAKQSPQDVLCRYFAKGKCRRGERCKFSHMHMMS